MKKYLLDANIILRYVVAENTPLNLKSKRYFDQARDNKCQLIIDNVTIAEVVWVLTSYYQFKRPDLVNSLKIIMGHKNILIDDKNLILNTLDFFSSHNLSYIDCYLHCLSQSKNIPLATFDTKLSKLK
jgi:predicted nucleic-acid-binding protein